MIRRPLILGSAFSLMSTCALAQTTGMPFILQSGETPQQALTMSEIDAQAAQLQSAWTAAELTCTSTAPSVVSGKILTTTRDVETPPAAPEIEVKFKVDDDTALSSIYAEFDSALGQRVSVQYQTPVGAQGPSSETIDLEGPPGHSVLYDVPSFFTGYSQDGTWTLTSLIIMDQCGNKTPYTESQLSNLFTSLTIKVTNKETPDTTAPHVASGQGSIQTGTVNVGSDSAFPSFSANLSVSDVGSGVRTVYLCVAPQPSGDNSGGNLTTYCQTTPASVPVTTSGTIAAAVCLSSSCLNLPAGTTVPTGTWEIYGFQVCDVPGNCFTDLSPSDMPTYFSGGTTTFTVEND
jgi:hypothetical protein